MQNVRNSRRGKPPAPSVDLKAPRPWPPSRRAIGVDAALWVGLMAPPVVLITSAVASGHGGPVPWAVLLVVAVVTGAALALARVRPLAALSVPVVLGLLLWTVFPPLVVDATAMVPLGAVTAFLVGLRVERARPVLRTAGALTGLGVLLVVAVEIAARGAFGVVSGLFHGLLIALVLVGAVILPWLAGRYRRQHTALVSTGWERAELLERQRQADAERARLRERARIAQDMHDSLGHELNLIALRAAALELASDVGERSQAAAGELRSSVATASERLREIIGVLRPHGEAAPVLPAPTDLAALVARAAESGMDVTFEPAGPPRPDGTAADVGDAGADRGSAEPSGPATAPRPADGHPTMVDRAAYRVVQEALTNAAKHAPGAAVAVASSRTATATVVSVVNEAPERPPAPGAGGGHGLAGLRERVRLLGGTLDAGPLRGGFAVIATLPHRPGSPGLSAAGAGDSADALPAPAPAESTAPAAPSESARALGRARLRARRGLRTAVVAPVAAGAGLAAVLLALQLSVGLDDTLAAPDYRRLRVGQDRADVERVLPPFQIVDVPGIERTARPGNAVCRYYWNSAQTEERAFFRLCFADDRLVAKQAFALDGRPAPPRPGQR